MSRGNGPKYYSKIRTNQGLVLVRGFHVYWMEKSKWKSSLSCFLSFWNFLMVPMFLSFYTAYPIFHEYEVLNGRGFSVNDRLFLLIFDTKYFPIFSHVPLYLACIFEKWCLFLCFQVCEANNTWLQLWKTSPPKMDENSGINSKKLR